MLKGAKQKLWNIPSTSTEKGKGCQCPVCRIYSRAYIRHLLKAKEMLGMRLCVLHNLYFYNTMMAEIRAAIEAGRYKEYKADKLGRMAGLKE